MVSDIARLWMLREFKNLPLPSLIKLKPSTAEKRSMVRFIIKCRRMPPVFKPEKRFIRVLEKNKLASMLLMNIRNRNGELLLCCAGAGRGRTRKQTLPVKLLS